MKCLSMWARWERKSDRLVIHDLVTHHLRTALLAVDRDGRSKEALLCEWP